MYNHPIERNTYNHLNEGNNDNHPNEVNTYNHPNEVNTYNHPDEADKRPECINLILHNNQDGCKKIWHTLDIACNINHQGISDIITIHSGTALVDKAIKPVWLFNKKNIWLFNGPWRGISAIFCPWSAATCSQRSINSFMATADSSLVVLQSGKHYHPPYLIVQSHYRA